MHFSIEDIQRLVLTHFGMTAKVDLLPGEIDLNYRISMASGDKFTLKIAHAGERIENLSFQHALIGHLAAAKNGLEVPRVIPAVSGESISRITAPDGSMRLMRLLTWINGRCIADVNPHTPELLEQVGALCARMCAALRDFDHPEAHRFMKWDPARTEWTSAHMTKITDAGRQALAVYFYHLFESQAVPRFPELRQGVNYNDANDYNILVSYDMVHPEVPGVIDFGDAVYTHTINELAIAAAYMMMHKRDPLNALFHLVKGFHNHFPMTPPEAEALFPLIGARLLISVICSAINAFEHPENQYLQISDAPAWELMEKMRNISPALALATIRYACGWEPCPKNALFREWVQAHFQTIVPVVAMEPADAVWLDLSVGSADLGSYADIEDPQKLHQRITEVMQGRVGIGRYDEVRPFYTADAYEVRGNQGPQWRTVHIGLDIFTPPGVPVYAPLSGIVHSFQDNAHDRDYGPTIILEHRVSETLTFYTLYGHLSRTSLTGLKKGQFIAAGSEFCQIGPMPENGNWSPHLHFQVILEILEKEGDYPGVAFPETRAIWTSLCPDPWLLLTGSCSEKPESMTQADILRYRKAHLGKNLSISYQQPLTMLRGWRQYLFDETGRRYLDTVNNVAHVGHEHPRIVRAGQRQMAVLNTNTRYLHDRIISFTEALLKTFPPELDVAYFVNSGSEANELAMRLAKTYTGHSDMIVVEAGYHGNTQACVDISSYKFDGPGGKGIPFGISAVPIPDAYRGIYRGNTPETGKKYAAAVGEAVNRIAAAGRGVAAFICESVISCGGQVELPTDYLKEATRLVRSAGGLYIADEVQTGCGRHGAHFWAFEEHGVVPDIVTIGKPIGNGHPMGVVVTKRVIADAFANGMEYFNTFGGNPVSCAIGLEVLRVIQEEGLQQNALSTGAYLKEQLKALSGRYPVIGDVRGPGLFLGIELVRDMQTLAPAGGEATYIANRMRELGILMSTDGPFHNVLKIKPPLVFGRKEADFLLEMMETVLSEDPLRLQFG